MTVPGTIFIRPVGIYVGSRNGRVNPLSATRALPANLVAFGIFDSRRLAAPLVTPISSLSVLISSKTTEIAQ